MIAIVVGGADCADGDVAAARELCAGRDVTFFVINDWIAFWPDAGAIGVTLHIDKLVREQKSGRANWLGKRTAAGLPPLVEIWAHRLDKAVPDLQRVADSQGSSGMLAVSAALRKGFRKIVLCGVPMDGRPNRFRSEKKWGGVTAFKSSWARLRGNIAPFVRSFSGYTKEIFGEPTVAWLDEPPATLYELPAIEPRRRPRPHPSRMPGRVKPPPPKFSLAPIIRNRPR